MNHILTRVVSQKDKEILEESLFYLKVFELRKICLCLNICPKEQKAKLIQKILFFINTGKIPNTSEMPQASIAKNSRPNNLAPDSYILYGSYKNDYATRSFFKDLIGNHFHFTAYGIDWINQRWRDGNPPTYKEFAEFWQEEYRRRKIKKAPAKKEWAYINFVQDYIKKYPKASRDQIMEAWQENRLRHVKRVENILKQFY